MKELIEKEPITPFTDRVNELYKNVGVSTILVIGGSGEYLSVADKIYMMQDFLISDVTEQSKAICIKYGVVNDSISSVGWHHSRNLSSERFSSYPEGCGTELLRISDMDFIFIGDERIDIRMLHNIVSVAQLNSIGFILRKIEVENNDARIGIDAKVDNVLANIETDGLESVFSTFFTGCERWLDLPRKNEIMAVINRMRKVRFIQE